MGRRKKIAESEQEPKPEKTEEVARPLGALEVGKYINEYNGLKVKDRVKRICKKNIPRIKTQAEIDKEPKITISTEIKIEKCPELERVLNTVYDLKEVEEYGTINSIFEVEVRGELKYCAIIEFDELFMGEKIEMPVPFNQLQKTKL